MPLFTSKGLDELPGGVQRFRLRLMRFNFTVSGKDLVVADTLSRAPVSPGVVDDEEFQHEVEAFINLTAQQLPASEHRMKEITAKQQEDDICTTLIKYCHENWPGRSHVASCAKPYLSVAAKFSVCNGLLLRGDQIIIPQSLQQEILGKLHCGHQRITKCRERVCRSVWWSGINTDKEVMISKCLICCKHKQQNAEPLMPTPFPEYPWQKVATDLFEWKKTIYVLVVNYYSRYIEVCSRGSTSSASSASVIHKLKTVFAHHGISDSLTSDNGPSSLHRSSTSFQMMMALITSPVAPTTHRPMEKQNEQ